MPLFRGTFLEKGGIIGIIFCSIWEIWVHFEEICRIMGTILRKYGKNCQEEQRICKSCLTISLRFEEISLHYRNMDIFHQLCEIMGSIFSDMGEFMGLKFENLA